MSLFHLYLPAQIQVPSERIAVLNRFEICYMSTLKGEKYKGVFARAVFILEHAECAKRRTISILMGNEKGDFCGLKCLIRLNVFVVCQGMS